MNDDTNAGRSTATCKVTEHRDGDIWVLTVSGTVDMLTVARLEAAIESVMSKSPGSLVVDLLAVDFLASVGIGALVSAHYNLDAQFAVVADGPTTARPLTLVGVADVVDIYTALDEALAAIRTDEPTTPTSD
ncbi:STAS domain-containing protein [Mycobacterium sp. C31M]